jgi:hypothetical protein
LGWLSLRRRIILVFKLKGSRWELQRKRHLPEGKSGWTRVEQPLRDPEEDLKAPGVRLTTTHVTLLEDCGRFQRQGGDKTTTEKPTPRPDGKPSVQTA